MPFVTVRLRTTLLPDLESGDLLQDAGPGPPSWIWRLLRPSFEVVTPVGTWRKAPHGDPGETTWPLGAMIVVGIAGTVVLALLKLGRKVQV